MLDMVKTLGEAKIIPVIVIIYIFKKRRML